MSVDRLKQLIAKSFIKPSPWRSKASGYACRESQDGHKLAGAETLIDETEQKMLGQGRCKLCGDDIFFEPKDRTRRE